MKFIHAWVCAAALLLLSTACSLTPYDVVMPLAETVSSARRSDTPVISPSSTPAATALPLIVSPTPTPTASTSPSPLPTCTFTALPGMALVTIINHTPFTVYVDLRGSRPVSYALSAASDIEARLAPGEYEFRWIISGEQAARGTITFAAGVSTWEIYDTPTLVDSPTPMWSRTPSRAGGSLFQYFRFKPSASS